MRGPHPIGSSTVNTVPSRRVVLHPDRPLVVGDDAVDDREAEAGAAPLGGEVGEEELLLRLRGDPPAGVRHLDLQVAVDRMRRRP